MVNNKISGKRFFEIGGMCEIRYINICTHREEIVYPRSTVEYNQIINMVLRPICHFFWNGWVYEPLIECLDYDGNPAWSYLRACAPLA